MTASSPSSRAETAAAGTISAVVVNYNAGDALVACVESLLEGGVCEVVVVDNRSTDSSIAALRTSGAGRETAVRVVEAQRNLGYGGGANLGISYANPASGALLVTNPDLTLRPGALDTLVERLEGDDSIAVVGPMLRDADGNVYPSGRAFPSLIDAVGHAFLGLIWGSNPWTRRYRHLGADQHRSREADWVSGACFLARRISLETVGGFDEAYFMYVEDVDLCWRLRRAGWRIWYEPAAEVDHEQGRSASQHPYKMLAAHHWSLWRYARRTAPSAERWMLPIMGAGLIARLLLAWADHVLRPVREHVLATTKVNHRARGEFQP